MKKERPGNICESCKYFQQHYVKLEEDHYSTTSSGHCVYPRLKLRKSYAKACQNYAGREAEA